MEIRFNHDSGLAASYHFLVNRAMTENRGLQKKSKKLHANTQSFAMICQL